MSAVQPDTSPVYQLKVTLRRSDPPIWRRLQVRGDTTLVRLHTLLQRAMGWSDSHIHEFDVGGVRYGVPIMEWPPEERARNERRFRLDQIVATVGHRFVYDYDFGDAWHLDIVVEAVLLPAPGVRYPRCLAGARAASPATRISSPHWAIPTTMSMKCGRNGSADRSTPRPSILRRSIDGCVRAEPPVDFDDASPAGVAHLQTIDPAHAR